LLSTVYLLGMKPCPTTIRGDTADTCKFRPGVGKRRRPGEAG
jgi:hypothetical protein